MVLYPYRMMILLNYNFEELQNYLLNDPLSVLNIDITNLSPEDYTITIT